MQTQDHKTDPAIRGRYITVAVRHLPLEGGVAVYVGGKWRATFESESDANEYADRHAERPWHVRAA